MLGFLLSVMQEITITRVNLHLNQSIFSYYLLIRYSRSFVDLLEKYGTIKHHVFCCYLNGKLCFVRALDETQLITL